tara:strand:+ start:1103 stop:2086 length:984 start_codon:yes stop_codon:yes gene_type:complete
MSFLKNVLTFPFTLWVIKGQMKFQNAFIKSFLAPIVDRFEKSNDGSLSELTFKKIKNYYGLGSVVLAGEAIAGLHGERLTRKERKALTCISAITGLYDDFFDLSSPDLERIKNLSDIDKEVPNLNTHESLFRALLKIALDNIDDVKTSKRYAEEVYKQQVASLRQKRDALSWKELYDITILKGGASLLLYRSVFNTGISEQEAEALFLVGGQLQVCNDIFDVVKDLKEGINTIGTKAKTIDQLRGLLVKMDTQNRLKIEALDLPNTKYFNNRIKFVTSQTYVALDLYEKATKDTNGEFRPESYDSKQITLAMDRPLNFLKAVGKYCS